MVWMSAGIAMTTNAKRVGSPFTAMYISGGNGQEIGIAGRVSGVILCLDLSGSAVIIQKSAFLAAPAFRQAVYACLPAFGGKA